MENLWATLQANAGEWLLRCDIRSIWELYSWILANAGYIIRIPEGVIFMSHWENSLSVRIHPVIWGKEYYLSPRVARSVLRDFHIACYTERIEVAIPVDAPKSLARWARRVGMTFEGTLRKAAFWKRVPTDAHIFSITAEELEKVWAADTPLLEA
jgi:hypothetical protein